MWRVQGFVLRVLHRYYGNNPLRLPQSHHVEDEVINSSAVLSTSRHTSDSSYSVSAQREGDEEQRRRQRSFQFEFADLPRYTALDAVGWGAAAALFVQICRRIHSQLSPGSEANPIPGVLTPPWTLHRCRILLEILSQRDILPRGRSVLSLQGAAESQNQEQTSAQSSSGTGSTTTSQHRQAHQTPDCSTCDQQRPRPPQDDPIPASCPLQNDGRQHDTEGKKSNDQEPPDEERLVGAIQNLQHAGDSSVPVILNIIGLENARRGNYQEAFRYFAAAARRGYSKAHFNVGVCYERGRGVGADREKAQHHYWQAAAGGHRLAQYRYAKLLLTTRGQQSPEELNTAIGFLEEASAAGLTEAQVCLASVFSQGSRRDGRRSVQYLKMAAESGDSSALLFLGQCFESGFGVEQNLRTAADYYKRAAGAGEKRVSISLTPAKGADRKGVAALRSTRSAPCFPVADCCLRPPPSSLAPRVCPSETFPLLPHSWSTGSLSLPLTPSPSPLHLLPPSSEGGACQWTVGVG